MWLNSSPPRTPLRFTSSLFHAPLSYPNSPRAGGGGDGGGGGGGGDGGCVGGGSGGGNVSVVAAVVTTTFFSLVLLLFFLFPFLVSFLYKTLFRSPSSPFELLHVLWEWGGECGGGGMGAGSGLRACAVRAWCDDANLGDPTHTTLALRRVHPGTESQPVTVSQRDAFS